MNSWIYLRLLALLSATAVTMAADWQERLRDQLPLLGHRNWIVVADSAYPLQISPGIETIYVEADQLTVVKAVLMELAQAHHVRPVVYTDAELAAVPEAEAAGIEDHRRKLGQVLSGRDVKTLPHEQIIAKLDAAGTTFKVLLIKTPLTLPYTSVFLELDCGYWSPESEQALRRKMATAP